MPHCTYSSNPLVGPSTINLVKRARLANASVVSLSKLTDHLIALGISHDRILMEIQHPTIDNPTIQKLRKACLDGFENTAKFDNELDKLTSVWTAQPHLSRTLWS